jgi:hypothetical protein
VARPRSMFTVAVCCLYLACRGAGSAKGDGIAEAGCDSTSLAHALAADTGKLSRRQREASSGGAAGGFTATGYYDSTGARKLLTVTYFGETGQTRYIFAFLTPSDYAVRVAEEHYETHMSGNVVSRSETTRYFCHGREQQSPRSSTRDTIDFAGVLADADSLLGLPH